jgi:pimeloyl-ACP methyl ester carboxylesterase
MKRKIAILSVAGLFFLHWIASDTQAGIVFFDPNHSGSDCSIFDYAGNPGSTEENCVPVFLIHGWNPIGDPGAEQSAGWQDFLAYFYSHPELSSKYKPYCFSYRSNVDSVDQMARNFSALMANLSGSGNSFAIGKKDFVIIAHSMGGLVARSMMGKKDSSTGSLGRKND